MQISMQNPIKIWSGTRALSALFKMVHCVLPAVGPGEEVWVGALWWHMGADVGPWLSILFITLHGTNYSILNAAPIQQKGTYLCYVTLTFQSGGI